MQIAITFRASHILFLNHGRGKYWDFKFHYFQHSFVTERPHSFLRRISLVLKHEKNLKTQASDALSTFWRCRTHMFQPKHWSCYTNIEYILITNLMHWLLFLFIKYYSPLHVSSIKCSSSGGYSCTHAAYGTVTLYESSCWLVGIQLEWELSLKLCTDRPPGTLIESDSTICCMCTTVSSWRWALEARNM